MKKFLPCLTIILLTGFAGIAQTPATSFETDFSPGAPTGTWYDWVGEMTITYENEEMKVVINAPFF